MIKGKVLLLVAVLILLAGSFLFANYLQTAKRPVPALPVPAHTTIPSQPPAPEQAEPPVTSTATSLKLDVPPAKNNKAPAAPISDYSYNLKKESNEKEILPGVSVADGNVNIRLSKKNENLRINGNQLLYQKNF